jgi:hypothetical protein
MCVSFMPFYIWGWASPGHPRTNPLRNSGQTVHRTGLPRKEVEEFPNWTVQMTSSRWRTGVRKQRKSGPGPGHREASLHRDLEQLMCQARTGRLLGKSISVRRGESGPATCRQPVPMHIATFPRPPSPASVAWFQRIKFQRNKYYCNNFSLSEY